MGICGRLAVLFASLCWAASVYAQALWVDTERTGELRVHLYFFWSERCPHCLDAHPFVEAIPRERPWVTLHALEVSRSRENSRAFERMAASIGRPAEAVPSFLFCGTMEVGWDRAETSGTWLLRRLDECRAGGGRLDDAARVELPGFGKLAPEAMSLPLFTVVLAALDAFNPCAFFVLLFLLSLLVHQRDRRRMLAVGAVFVLASGAMYFAFMAAWLNVFQWLGTMTGVTLAAGVLAMVFGGLNLKDFLGVGARVSLSIPEAAKPTIYRRARDVLTSERAGPLLGATVVLAVVANFYELLCTAGLPMIFTRVLTLHEPAQWGRYAYLALYNLVYVMPLALIVGAFAGALARRKLGEREGRLLKLLSGMMMFELGVVLVVAPQWLSNVVATLVLFGVALAVVGVAAWVTKKPR